MSEHLVVVILIPVVVAFICIVEYVKDRCERKHGRDAFADYVALFFALLTIVLFILSIISIWVYSVFKTISVSL